MTVYTRWYWAFSDMKEFGPSKAKARVGDVFQDSLAENDRRMVVAAVLVPQNKRLMELKTSRKKAISFSKALS